MAWNAQHKELRGQGRLLQTGPMTDCSVALALFQIQLKTLLLWLKRQAPTVQIRDEFQAGQRKGTGRGMETMESFKNRIRKGIIQQEIDVLGLDDKDRD
jgi:hypothetical protein